MSASAWSGRPYIDLGPSDNIALDQPRVAIELFKDPSGARSVGPEAFNTLLLDTGTNSVLAMASATNDMKPLGYTTQGRFEEHGVAGAELLDISVPYRFDFAGSNGQRLTLDGTRILSYTGGDFSILGPWGLVGMPSMVNRVTTLDFTGWSGGLDPWGDNLYMEVAFADAPPAGNGHRYTVSVDNRVRFDPAEQMLSGDPPVWADIPFLTAVPINRGRVHPGNFVFDTGAQLSVMSTNVAAALGLDTNGDGQFDENDDAFDGYEEVSGIGGTVIAPAFGFEQVHLPTDQGTDLVWTDLRWLVLDIAPGIDGVIGSDMLTSGWFEAFLLGAEDGYLEQVHFDFRNMATAGTGKLLFDLSPVKDQVTTPVPQIAGRWIFYNNSTFDGNSPAANAQDDSAIAPDKEPLMPGDPASFYNYTSYSRGINGVMVDIANLPSGGMIDKTDFSFRVGNTADPSTWKTGPAPTSVTVRRGAGLGGSDRVTLIWPDGAIQKQWLQVTVLPNADTGLPAPDVFYFGNAVGESGDSTTDARVTAVDLLMARNNQRSFLNPAPIEFEYDHNRDGRVNAADVLIARNNQTSFLNALKFFTAPLPGAKSAAVKELPPRATGVSPVLGAADATGVSPVVSAGEAIRQPLFDEHWPGAGPTRAPIPADSTSPDSLAWLADLASSPTTKQRSTRAPQRPAAVAAILAAYP